jgi:ribonuclease HI
MMLWREFEEATSRHRVTWEWLNGYAGHPDNERCDRLAAAEIVKVRRTYTPEKLAALREAFIASRDPNRNQANLF